MPLLIGLQFVTFNASSQQPYSLIHYDENVLPQTTIGNIQQDIYGYLWMSTQFGIVRFDGENFRVFTTDNLKGLRSNRIRLCAKGLDQRIYFVDEYNVIVKVISPNEFETVALSDAIKESKPLYNSHSNNDFAFLPFAKNSGYEQLANSLELYPGEEPLKSYAISEKEGYFFYLDLQRKTRICFYRGTTFTSSIQSDSFQPKHTFKLNNRVFVQLSSTEAQLLKEADQKVTIPVIGLPSRYTQTFNAQAIMLFSNETGAFFYSSGNLYQYEYKDSSLVATLVFENLPCTAVVDIMKERTTGDFLISTKSNGFYRVKRKQFGVINLTSSHETRSEEHNMFNSNIVYALALWDPKHIMCTGYIMPVAGAGEPRYFARANKAHFNFFFMHSKDDNHVWLNFESSIQDFNKKTGSYSAIANIDDPQKAIEFSNGATVIVAARSITNLHNGQVTELLKTDELYFTTAEKVSEDCILVGTHTGLGYFYPSGSRLEPVRYKETLKIRYIFKDKAGRIWFTTYGQGLFYLSGNTIVPIPLDNAGYLSIGHNISEDNSGNFWVATNHGLFKLGYTSLLAIISGKSSKLFYTYFDKTDGFNTNEFNGGCYPSSAYQKETGMLFLPSMDGVVKFNPDSIRSVNSNGPIFFDEIVRNDTGKIYHVTDKMIFPSQTSTLRLNFSSPYYGHVENIKFSYTLSNASRHWIELEGERSIKLSNLPGGSYTLVLKKEDATNAPILASFRFEIEKKFTETVLFKLLLLAGVIGLVYLYFRARLRYLSMERKRLEKEVLARTADQLNLIDQLKNNIYQLKQLQLEKEQMIEHKENVIAILIHDIKSPLYFLNTVAAHLDKGMDSNTPRKNKKIASEISISLNRLYIFTQDFAIWLEASRPGYIQHREAVDLETVIPEALTIYKEIIEKKNIIIVRQTSVPISVFGDAPMIKSVIRNLIDNAVKNTTSGHISIRTNCLPDAQSCEIIIADEGKGMSNEDIVAINNYFQSSNGVQDFSASGFGHKVIRDFVSKLGGEIAYAPNTPSGIVVTLKLPVMNPFKAHEGPGSVALTMVSNNYNKDDVSRPC
jgi:signal transduction histidine kinase